jgi:hypothetical protein
MDRLLQTTVNNPLFDVVRASVAYANERGQALFAERKEELSNTVASRALLVTTHV